MATYGFVRTPLFATEPAGAGEFPLSDADGNLVSTAKSGIPLSGFGAAAADVALGGFKLTNVGAPTAGGDAANKTYVDGLIQGIDAHPSVRVATTAAGTLASSFENGDTVDGVVLATGNRILIKNQLTASENGIYTVNASGAPTRATDLASGASAANTFVFVEEGTVNADTGWVCTDNVGSDVVGTNNLTFVQFSSAGIVVADEVTLTKSGNTISEKDGGTTYAKIQDVAALSVIGRSVNSSGVSGAIPATPASGAVLRESGSTIGFGTIATAGIGDNQVTYAKLQQLAALTILNNPTNAAGNVQATPLAQWEVLQNVTGTTLTAGYHRNRQGTGAPPSATANDVGSYYYRVSSSGGGTGAYGRLYVGVQLT